MEASISPSPSATGTAESHLLSSSNSSTALPNSSILDLLFPGFSILFTIVDKYVGLDLNFYMPLLIFLGSLIVAWRYFSEYFQAQIEAHLMSVVDIRTDDEIYNMLMAWVAEQKFSQGARRFVANTNLNSRAMWWTWWRELDEEDEEEDEMGEDGLPTTKKKKKALSYTPTFGSHWFFYRGRILIFRRQLPQNQWRGGPPSEKEEIQIQCFGRSPWILKELINEARENYIKKDEHKTLIYRGGIRGQNSEPSWQRCMSRNTRPFSTVILNEKVKKDLIDDVTDYLNPATRRWYANRGIPYRRGYLLYGPPGTGKSSLSLALAGFFKMRIYIVSLSSITANEENLASLFNDLPRRCVVLLEDIDTAGLTHTRENVPNDTGAAAAPAPAAGGGGGAPVTGNLPIGRLSLSGLLNILDGVASQEGRVLIMTTNHIEKLDKALIRPGRVDMVVKFDRADPGMTAAIFRAIYAPLEEDASPNNNPKSAALAKLDSKLSPPAPLDPEQEAKAAQEKQKILDKVDKLAKEFASKIPDKEFSPAEIQGFLLKNKRDPQRAVDGADEWIVEARKEKVKREEEKAREEEEKKEKEKKEEEEKKKEEEEGKKKEDEEKKVREELEKKLRQEFEMRARMDAEMKALRRKNRREDVTDSDESESESERKQQEEKRRARKARKAARALHAAEADVTKQKKEELGEVAQAVVVVDAPAGIKVDTKKANQAAAAEELKGVKTAPDSGYGTPGVPGTP